MQFSDILQYVVFEAAVLAPLPQLQRSVQKARQLCKG